MKKLVLVLLFCSTAGFAQQDAQFTQYMHNTININPAYAGSRGAMSIFGLYRTQWVGLDGAPETSSFSVNTPVGNNIGLGVSLINDKTISDAVKKHDSDRYVKHFKSKDHLISMLFCSFAKCNSLRDGEMHVGQISKKMLFATCVNNGNINVITWKIDWKNHG